MLTSSMPARADAAESKDWKPSIGLIRRLMNRWSCSMMLLRYFRLTISIGTGQPKPFSILFIALMPAVLAPLLSMTIFHGKPFASSARAQNLVAAVLFRRSDSMKSSVCRICRSPCKDKPIRLSSSHRFRPSATNGLQDAFYTALFQQ